MRFFFSFAVISVFALCPFYPNRVLNKPWGALLKNMLEGTSMTQLLPFVSLEIRSHSCPSSLLTTISTLSFNYTVFIVFESPLPCIPH